MGLARLTSITLNQEIQSLTNLKEEVTAESKAFNRKKDKKAEAEVADIVEQRKLLDKETEAIEDLRADYKEELAVIKGKADNANKKELDEISKQRTALNGDIARGEKLDAKIEADKKALKEGTAKLEKEKKAYKAKIMDEFKKKFV